MRIGASNVWATQNMLQQTNIKAQTTQLQKMVDNLNFKIQQQNQNYDTVKLSIEAKELLKTEKENAGKTIDYKNSSIVGKRSLAEWAESSLTQQRNGVSSVKDGLEYQKEKLETSLSKMSAYEKIANGEVAQADTFISKERAAALVGKYKESIKNDFSTDIDATIKFYNDWVKAYDKYSGGLAFKVMGNVLEGISAKSLGLDNLSDNPYEIIKALDDAIERLDNLAKSIESNFYQATGNQKEMTEYTLPNKDWWKSNLDVEIAVIEMATVDGNTGLTGETFKIDD